jgi:hypothetical protein
VEQAAVENHQFFEFLEESIVVCCAQLVFYHIIMGNWKRAAFSNVKYKSAFW